MRIKWGLDGVQNESHVQEEGSRTKIREQENKNNEDTWKASRG